MAMMIPLKLLQPATLKLVDIVNLKLVKVYE